MPITRPFAGNRRGLLATAVTGVLALAGLTCIGVVVTHQQHAPEPPLSAAPVVDAPIPASLPTSAPAAGASPAAPAAPKIVGPVLASSPPTAISIPAIRVQSTLLSLGRTASDTLQVPLPGPDYNKAGWYKYSPTPGSVGPAVIAGHVDSAAEGPSVFYRLGGLHAGDKVDVTRVDGSVAIFTVDSVLRFHKVAFPTELVYGNTNHAALRLITCGGQFDSATGHYLDNIVVLASLVNGSTAQQQTNTTASG